MTDPRRHPDRTSARARNTERGAPPGMPRWVKVSGIVVGFLVLALVAITFIIGGDHGPSRHAGVPPYTESSAQVAPGDEATADHDGLVRSPR